MTGRDLLESMSLIDDQLVEEAEKKPFPTDIRKPRSGAERRLPIKKVLLIAAAIGVTVTLVGCAVAYVMHRTDFQVGQQEATKPVLAENGWRIEGYEPITEQVLSLSGLEGSPNFQAVQEWYDFKRAYDPDHLKQVTLQQEGKIPQFPAEYDSYMLYSQEMKDRLDEILDKYDLKPVGEILDFRTERNLYAALGVDAFLKTEGGITVTGDGGGCYENGNFWLNLGFDLPEDPESQVKQTWGILRWNRKECFSDDLITIEETGDWEEWNYTAASGRTALILRSPSDWRGWIIFPREDGVLSLQIEARRDIFTNDGEKDTVVFEYTSNRQLEAVAEAVDRGIEPRLVTREDVENQPQPSYEATQNGYTIALKQVETDGYLAYLTIGITAPEGTVISHSTREGREKEPFYIETRVFNTLTSETGDIGYGGWSPKEDGDGKDNTEDIVIAAKASGAETGKAPFAPGSQWTLYIEDLIHTDLTEDMYPREETLAEGEWRFPFTIGEEDGDFREAELLSEPIITKAEIGWDGEGKPVLVDMEITSFKLRKYTAELSCEDANVGILAVSCVDRQRAQIVMKDGSSVELSDEHDPIDLDQVDYVLLTDGTKLFMPENFAD